MKDSSLKVIVKISLFLMTRINLTSHTRVSTCIFVKLSEEEFE